MKSKNFAVFAVCAVLSLALFSGCLTTEPEGDEKPAKPGEETVWSLLRQGKVEEAKELYKGKALVADRDEKGRTTLHLAAEMEDADLARYLLALGADPAAKDDSGRTPLAVSAAKEDSGVGAVLAAAGSDIHQPLSYNTEETIALKALKGKQDFLKSILTRDNVTKPDAQGMTLLHLAAREGAAAAVPIVIAAGGEVNLKDREGETPLDVALERTDSLDHANTSEKLILAGGTSANPFYQHLAPPVRSSNYNLRLVDGSTLYHYAAAEGYGGYLDYLAAKKADVNLKNNAGSTPLHEASRSGKIDAIEKCIAAGAQVNAQDAKGNTALHLAIPPEQHRNAVVTLFAKGANPNLKDVHGEIPLQVAVTLGRDYGVVESLLSEKSEINNRDVDGKTALYQAVEYDRLSLIPLLLHYNADIFAADNTGLTPIEKAIRENRPALDALINEDTVKMSDSAGDTILHIAVRNRSDPVLTSQILDKGAAVNARNKAGDTALHIAVAQNDQPNGKLLIDRNADIFAQNAAGESPLYLAFHNSGTVRDWMLTEKTMEARDGLGNSALHYAAQWKLGEYVPLMVSRGARLEATNATGETPVFWAARADSPETIEALVRAGAQIAARDSLGNSVLHCAVRWNAKTAAPYLISQGINVNSQNLAGKSPLHESVRLGLVEMEEILCQRGANVDLRDAQGNTPLMEAVQAGFPGAAERLTNRGADPALRNNSGDTPLHIAVLMQRYDLTTLLLGCGAPIHARNSAQITPFTTALGISPNMTTTLLTKDRLYTPDDDGLSPLHIAIKQRAQPATIQAIIARGCKMSAVDKEGRTPLRLALDMNSFGEAKVLADAGSDVFVPATDGITPAEEALKEGANAINAVFSGSAIAARDGTGNTVLHYAAKFGDAQAVRSLINLGADKSIRNIAGESPAEIARRWNNSDAATVLQ